METPIARIARWFAYRKDLPAKADQCDHCSRHLDPDEGTWDRFLHHRTCDLTACQDMTAANRSW